MVYIPFLVAKFVSSIAKFGLAFLDFVQPFRLIQITTNPFDSYQDFCQYANDGDADHR
jgi:hypothetical protein